MNSLKKTRIDAERKRTIDDLIDPIKPAFNSHRNFDRLFGKYRIKYLEGYSFPDLIITTIRGEKFLFNYPRIFRTTREVSTAHELAHLVLTHTKTSTPKEIGDTEAEYFASKLTGHSKMKNILLTLIETIVLYINNKEFRGMTAKYESNTKEYQEMMLTRARASRASRYRA